MPSIEGARSGHAGCSPKRQPSAVVVEEPLCLLSFAPD